MKLLNLLSTLPVVQGRSALLSQDVNLSNSMNLIENMDVMQDIEAQNFILEKWNEEVPDNLVENFFDSVIEDKFYDAIGETPTKEVKVEEDIFYDATEGENLEEVRVSEVVEDKFYDAIGETPTKEVEVEEDVFLDAIGDEDVKEVEVEEDVFLDAIGDEDGTEVKKFNKPEEEFKQERSSDANVINSHQNYSKDEESRNQKEKNLNIKQEQNRDGGQEYSSFSQTKSNKNLKHTILKGLIVGVATIGFGTLMAFGGGFLLAGLASTAVGAVSGAIFGSIMGATIGYGVASGVGFGVTAFASTGAGVGAAVGAYSGFSIAVNSVKKGTQKFLKATGLEKVGKALFNFGEEVGSALPAIDKHARAAKKIEKIINKHNEAMLDGVTGKEAKKDKTQPLNATNEVNATTKNNLDASSVEVDKSKGVKTQKDQQSKSPKKDAINPTSIPQKATNSPKLGK